MMVIRIEVWPGGNKGMRKIIGTMELGNVSELAEMSDYAGRIIDENGKATKHFKVYGHKRSLGPWELLRKALTAFDTRSCT